MYSSACSGQCKVCQLSGWAICTSVAKASAAGYCSLCNAGSAEYAEAQSKALQQLQHKTYEEQRFKAPRELVAGAGLDEDAVLASTANGTATAVADAKPAGKKRKKVAGGLTEETAAAAAVAAAAEAAAANAAVAKQAAALANKRRKTNSGKASKGSSGKAAAAAGEEGDVESMSPVKVEEGALAPAAAGSRRKAAAAPDGEGEQSLPRLKTCSGSRISSGRCVTLW